jgi:hypothetical protein
MGEISGSVFTVAEREREMTPVKRIWLKRREIEICLVCELPLNIPIAQLGYTSQSGDAVPKEPLALGSLTMHRQFGSLAIGIA